MGGKSKTTSDTNTSNQYNNQQQQQQSGNQSGAFDTQNELGFAEVPETQAYKDLSAWRPQANAAIPSIFGAQRRRAMSSYNNLGSEYSTPGLMQARMRATDEEIGEREATAYQQDAQQMNDARFGQLNALTGYAQPVSYNKRSSGVTSEQSSGNSSMTGSGTGSGTSNTVNTQPKPGLFGSILGAGLGVASKFI